MPLPSFSNGAVLTAAQLNAIVDRLNVIEQITDVPSPLFQQVMLDAFDHAGLNSGAERTWRYLILHQSVNRYLHYRYQWSNVSGGPSTQIWVANNATAYVLTSNSGITSGTIDLQAAPLSIPAGNAYVVKVRAVRQASTWFKLDWLYESKFA